MVGSGFCMIAVEFGENVMALIRCIGKGRGLGFWCFYAVKACMLGGWDRLSFGMCVCVCGRACACVYCWEALCFVLVVSVVCRRWNI